MGTGIGDFARDRDAGASVVWPIGERCRLWACSASAARRTMPGMKRKRLFLFGVFVAAVLVAGYLLIPVGEGRISQSNCDKIQIGWSQHQVVRLLREQEISGSKGTEGRQVSMGVSWSDEDGNRIEIDFYSFNGFDSLGVTQKKFVPTDLSFFECMKRRFERRLKAMLP
jgi:hypothetical protein